MNVTQLACLQNLEVKIEKHEGSRKNPRGAGFSDCESKGRSCNNENANPIGGTYIDHYRDPIIKTELFAMEKHTGFTTLQSATEIGVSSAILCNKEKTLVFQEKVLSFPLLLYKILSDAPEMGFERIISWRCHGRGFQGQDRLL